jgi:single-strand DNA-binding protein
MFGINTVQILGVVCNNATPRETLKGSTVINFMVETFERYKDDHGNFHEYREYHKIVAWGKLAEVCGQYLNKGEYVFLIGRLKTQYIFEDNEQPKRGHTSIVLSEIKFINKAINGNNLLESKETIIDSMEPVQIEEDIPEYIKL